MLETQEGKNATTEMSLGGTESTEENRSSSMSTEAGIRMTSIGAPITSTIQNGLRAGLQYVETLFYIFMGCLAGVTLLVLGLLIGLILYIKVSMNLNETFSLTIFRHDNEAYLRSKKKKEKLIFIIG